MFSGSFALGTKIFMMGGCIPGDLRSTLSQGSVDVFSFDTKSDVDSFEWRKEPTHLLAKRFNPALVATHSKIYMFGDNRFNPEPPTPWAEVYDPESNLSSPLPDHPPELSVKSFEHIFAALVANVDKIICVQCARASYFDMINGSWTQISFPFCEPYNCTLSFRFGLDSLIDVVTRKIAIVEIKINVCMSSMSSCSGASTSSSSGSSSCLIGGEVVGHKPYKSDFWWCNFDGGVRHRFALGA
ncbi:hypothetical protein IFM89_022365 [Coptis chinensis]|uniref:F-box/kelch-repeat protein n=1 Tax=Coptis chinensis TaxID=261450 RepID=A0A835GXG5_9MAGN|nr:hypothetical protein IFM89_022365 [Coptis chinensis]